MDFFSKLPSLVQSNIFTHLNSERCILQLIRASPVMLAHYVEYRPTITRYRLTQILALDHEGIILQDALAVIQLPAVKMGSQPKLNPFTLPPVLRTIRSWEAQEFRDPLLQSDQDNIARLYRFFSRLITFIEDYLAKALDPFPARAYLTLPDLASVVPQMLFKGRKVDIKPVAFGAMRNAERFRLLKAFVRYELLCKVHHPKIWGHLKGDIYAEIIKRSYQNLMLKDYEALYCVHEYFKGLYGAIYAHCQDSWLPDRQSHSNLNTVAVVQTVELEHQIVPSSKDYGLLYPDNVYFNAREYSYGLVRGSLKDLLPCLGLDHLSDILMSSRSDEKSRDCLRGCLEIIPRYEDPYIDTPWILSRHFTRHHEHLVIDETKVSSWKTRLESRVQLLRYDLGWRQCLNLEAERDRNIRELDTHILQHMIFHQRAWVFFDDSSLEASLVPHFPSFSELATEDHAASEMLALTTQPERRSLVPHFPSFSELATEDDDASGMLALTTQRKRRRSQKWQDYWSGRALVHPLDQKKDVGNRMVADMERYQDRALRFFERPRYGEVVTRWKVREVREAGGRTSFQNMAKSISSSWEC